MGHPDQGKRYRDSLLDLLFTTAGCLVMALAMQMFIAPNQIAPGGASGLAVVLHSLVPTVGIGTWSFFINIPLLLIGLKFLGWAFTLKTLGTVVLLSIMIDYGVQWAPVYQGDVLLACLFGGSLLGAGMALVLMRGFTTGGTDILSRLFQLKFPYIQLGRLLMLIDLFVIALSAVVFGTIETALYGVVTVYTSARVIDTVLYGMDTGKLLHIISGAHAEIARRLMEELGRGCTLLKAAGGYTRTETQVLLVAVRRQQYVPLRRLVHEIDPKAFIIVSDSSEVLGLGFKTA